jgi:hypothetical protein
VIAEVLEIAMLEIAMYRVMALGANNAHRRLP